MKKIGVFTSGGDAPGMNACLRAVVRTALYHGVEVVGIYRGYEGMIEGDFNPMTGTSVSNIIQRGGTILKAARSKEFLTKEGRAKAADQLRKAGVDGLVVIGGDGSFRGAQLLEQEHGFSVMGCPGTIDNDLHGTDFTIGFDTAINTVVQAVDKIRDTATSHNRLFFIEVMGRDAGAIALASGLATGAEAVLVPETPTYLEELINKLKTGWERKKSSAIIIVAEGDDSGGAYNVAEKVKAQFDKYDTRITVLGHIQRGGNPSARDRILGSTLGNAATLALLQGKSGAMAGQINKEIVFTPFQQATKEDVAIDSSLMALVEVLSS